MAMGCEDSAGPATEVNVPLLYLSQCARCHGPEGAGVPGLASEFGRPANLSDPVWQDSRTNAQIESVIAMGRGKMPAFRGTLTHPKIQALVAHVRSLRRSPSAPKPPAPDAPSP